MVNITHAQSTILKNLESARQKYDTDSAAFEAQVAVQREALKANIRSIVAEAESKGLPQRRIYMALGFDQPGPYLNFMKQKVAAPLMSPAFNIAPAKPVGEWEAQATTEDTRSPYTIELTDTFGNPAGNAVAFAQTTQESFLVSAIRGEHTDKRQLKNAVEDLLNEINPDYDIEWRE